MAEYWRCRSCDTVNDGDSDKCIVCDRARLEVLSGESPKSETPHRPVSWEPVAPRPVAEPVPDEPPPATAEGRRSRRLATGRALGVGHVALFMTAVVFLLSETGLGTAMLRLAYFPIIPHSSTWPTEPVIHQTVAILDDLPWAVHKWPYLVLALACLVMRLARTLPGPLSLAIAIPAALYGVLIAVAEVPILVDCWPLTLVALAGSWVIVAMTLS